MLLLRGLLLLRLRLRLLLLLVLMGRCYFGSNLVAISWLAGDVSCGRLVSDARGSRLRTVGGCLGGRWSVRWSGIARSRKTDERCKDWLTLLGKFMSGVGGWGRKTDERCKDWLTAASASGGSGKESGATREAPAAALSWTLGAGVCRHLSQPIVAPK
ncbi:hypothetical protein JB92DRAFT_3101652 [Gautieria morchelliformis]|nr:hypothetical protein JB92DRAFT_3101652 [Gautieria morchelliformis]